MYVNASTLRAVVLGAVLAPEHLRHLHPEASRPGPMGWNSCEHKVPHPGQRPGALSHSSQNSRANSSSWFFSSPLSRSSSAKIMVRSLSWKKASSRPGSPLGAGAGAGGGGGSGGGGSCRGGSLGGFPGGGTLDRVLGCGPGPASPGRAGSLLPQFVHVYLVGHSHAPFLQQAGQQPGKDAALLEQGQQPQHL